MRAMKGVAPIILLANSRNIVDIVKSAPFSIHERYFRGNSEAYGNLQHGESPLEDPAKTWMYRKSYCLQICLMMTSQMKLFFSKRLILAGFSVRTIIPFLRSSVSVTGIILEVEARRPASTCQERNGGFLQKTESSPSKQLNHTLNRKIV